MDIKAHRKRLFINADFQEHSYQVSVEGMHYLCTYFVCTQLFKIFKTRDWSIVNIASAEQ